MPYFEVITKFSSVAASKSSRVRNISGIYCYAKYVSKNLQRIKEIKLAFFNQCNFSTD